MILSKKTLRDQIGNSIDDNQPLDNRIREIISQDSELQEFQDFATRLACQLRNDAVAWRTLRSDSPAKVDEPIFRQDPSKNFGDLKRPKSDVTTDFPLTNPKNWNSIAVLLSAASIALAVTLSGYQLISEFGRHNSTATALSTSQESSEQPHSEIGDLAFAVMEPNEQQGKSIDGFVSENAMEIKHRHDAKADTEILASKSEFDNEPDRLINEDFENEHREFITVAVRSTFDTLLNISGRLSQRIVSESLDKVADASGLEINGIHVGLESEIVAEEMVYENKVLATSDRQKLLQDRITLLNELKSTSDYLASTFPRRAIQSMGLVYEE